MMGGMNVRKYRWSKVYESAEEELQQYLTAHGFVAERWEAVASHEFTDHAFDTDTTIFCAEGSLSFAIDTEVYSLQPGDALCIPAFVGFAATAGFSGCVCYEAAS